MTINECATCLADAFADAPEVFPVMPGAPNSPRMRQLLLLGLAMQDDEFSACADFEDLLFCARRVASQWGELLERPGICVCVALAAHNALRCSAPAPVQD